MKLLMSAIRQKRFSGRTGPGVASSPMCSLLFEHFPVSAGPRLFGYRLSVCMYHIYSYFSYQVFHFLATHKLNQVYCSPNLYMT